MWASHCQGVKNIVLRVSGFATVCAFPLSGCHPHNNCAVGWLNGAGPILTWTRAFSGSRNPLKVHQRRVLKANETPPRVFPPPAPVSRLGHGQRNGPKHAFLLPPQGRGAAVSGVRQSQLNILGQSPASEPPLHKPTPPRKLFSPRNWHRSPAFTDLSS